MSKNIFYSLISCMGLWLIAMNPGFAQENSASLEPIELVINIQEDMTRKPIHKAICRIYEGDQVKGQYISDESGNIKIKVQPYKLVNLNVIADGFYKIDQPIDTRNLSSIKWTTRISMMKEGLYRFKGVLLDEAFENFVPDIQMKMYDRTEKRTYLTTSNERGVYFFTLTPGHDYDVLVDQPKYLRTRSTILNCLDKETTNGVSVFCTSGFSLLDSKKDRETEQKMIVGTTRLQKLELNKAYKVDNIYYDYGKASIRSDARPKLDNLYQVLTDNPGIKIELASHTDSRGRDAFNLELSQKRAESVVNYLIAKGIPKSRMVPKGYGESKILNKCKNGVDCSDKLHEANRRTEFKVVGFIEKAGIEVEPAEEIEIDLEEEVLPVKTTKPRANTSPRSAVTEPGCERGASFHPSIGACEGCGVFTTLGFNPECQGLEKENNEALEVGLPTLYHFDCRQAMNGCRFCAESIGS